MIVPLVVDEEGVGLVMLISGNDGEDCLEMAGTDVEDNLLANDDEDDLISAGFDVTGGEDFMAAVTFGGDGLVVIEDV